MHPKSNTRTIPLSRGLFAVVDSCDYAMLSHWSWHADSDGYAVSSSDMKMHRVIMLPDPGQLVDHVNHSRSDNRRCNLRRCDHTENVRNSIKRMARPGYRGLYRNGRQWYVRIMVDGKRNAVGASRDRVEAALIYDLVAIKHHGEFAQTNYLIR